MRVMVIPEDSRRDKDLLKPLIEGLMAELGRPRAKVRVCEKPVLGGVSQALRWERIETILELWGGQTDLFLLIVDRDGIENAGRKETLSHLEQRSQAVLKEGQALLGEHAIEEVEVWVLAGLDLPSDWNFREVRADPHPKETYFARYLTERRKLDNDAAGRTILAEEAAHAIRRIRDRCPEDFQRLADRIRARL